jgi:hypothetical protein
MSFNNHKWEHGESLQWASNGFPWESARTEYVCKNCGIKFIHYYHIEPSIYKAFEESGLPKECEGQNENL